MLSSSKTRNIAVLKKFFSRSYFARLWIVQELLLARTITMHCGEISLMLNNESISQLYEQDVEVPSWVKFVGKVKADKGRAPLDLKDLLAATSVCRVTDLRDKIFGLLGLVSNDQASERSPDYDLMVREVYIGVAVYLIQKDHCCDLLQYANPHWLMSCDLDWKNAYGIPSWVPMWDAHMPLQASRDISRHIQHIELDSKNLLIEETGEDCLVAIRILEGWPDDKNSECQKAEGSCKMVHSGSGLLQTRIETVFSFDASSSPLTIRPETPGRLECHEYATTFWDLKDGIELVVRSFAWALSHVYRQRNIHLIRVEGCATLFLAEEVHDSLQYRLINPRNDSFHSKVEEPSTRDRKI
ncbi:hypothetical protein FNYG_07802 [Fusarium nygamai]|uniref:Heterokaryon incompatibility domain-containing protein n=1 Tax=Gibberella nygamai TaxID=42673 RepID=A0A2K0W9I9_GIBNY|nr:hypothetical protein FNYG_07802 [Fusarium nygamai]